MSETFNIDHKQIDVKEDLFTWSNLISLSRILIVIPVVYLHYTNGQQITWGITALVIYGIVSDYLDGFVARMTNQVSEWGKILDPVADKFCAFFLFLYAVYVDIIPFWFFVIAVARDVIIVIGSGYIQHLRGKVSMAIMSGKISVNVLGLYWMAAFFFPRAVEVHFMLMGASLALMFYSFFDYLHRFNLIRKGVEFN
ncbi:MAG: CDP-alcohol phosphatidyltransferase family protein [Bacteroidota bacterium]